MKIMSITKNLLLVLVLFATSSLTYAQTTFYDMPSGTVYTCEGVLRDPGGPNDYVDFTDAISTFCALTPGHHVYVEFTMVDIEAGYDFLYVHDGSDTSAAVLDTISGPVYGQQFCSTSGCLTFRFFSDYSIQGAGWEADMSCFAECPVEVFYDMPGNRINTCYGTFRDTGGEMDHENFEDTVTTFCASGTDSLIRVNFNFVDVEDNYDYLYIHDGPTTSFPILDSLDGYFTNLEYTSSQGCLTFRFVSDFSVVNSGWEGVLSCVWDSSTVGVTELENEAFGFSIYPNPAADNIQLRYDDAAIAKDVERVVLYSLWGQKVKEVLGPAKEMDLNSIANGTYLVAVHFNDQVVFERLIIAHSGK